MRSPPVSCNFSREVWLFTRGSERKHSQVQVQDTFISDFQATYISSVRFSDAMFLLAEWRLFCVRGELPQEGSLLEVDCCCASLRSRGSVVLLNSQQGELYLWIGCKAHNNTREVSKRAVEQLTQMYLYVCYVVVNCSIVL